MANEHADAVPIHTKHIAVMKHILLCLTLLTPVSVIEAQAIYDLPLNSKNVGFRTLAPTGFWTSADSLDRAFAVSLVQNKVSATTVLGQNHFGIVRTRLSTTFTAEGDSNRTAELILQQTVLGGGNLSSDIQIPLFFKPTRHVTSLLLLETRNWMNIPQLSDAEDVRNLGGDVSIIPAFGFIPDENKDRAPAIVLQIKIAAMYGTDAFMSSIGAETRRLHYYRSGSILLHLRDKQTLHFSMNHSESLDFAQGIRLGVHVKL